MSDLQTVTITTKLGAVYVFPDVDAATFQKDFCARACGSASFTLVNASSVVMVLPVRIIKSVMLGEEELWKV